MSKRDYHILYIYYTVEFLLFFIIKGAELSHVGRPLDFIRYSAIVCNFIMMTFLYLWHGRRLDKGDNLIPLAFVLTLAADTFLCIIKGDLIPVGYFLFFLVETVYMFYLKPTLKGVAVRLALYAVLLVWLWREGMLTLAYAIAMANMVQLAVNLVCAWMRNAKGKSREALLFALGITLFFGCDFSIVIRTLTEEGTTLHNIVTLIVWTCYIPAQVLLLSSYVEKLKDN